jgi:hypothetical protein
MPSRRLSDDENLIQGDVVRARSITRHIDASDCTLAQTFKAEKGDHLVFLYLGVSPRGETFDAIQALRDMGWTPPPELEAEPEVEGAAF